MAIKYVDNFEFPREAGFTGSAESSRPHFKKGGAVHKSGRAGMPKNVMKEGGHAHHGKMHDDPGPLPRKVKKTGGHARKMEHGGMYGKGGSTHDKLMKAGGEMGFKAGGYAAMDDMDHANLQRKKSLASDQRSKEFGDQPPVKPGMKKGGAKKETGAHRTETEKRVGKKLPKGARKKIFGAQMTKAEKERMPVGERWKKRSEIEMEKRGYAEGGKWIKDAIKKPGALRKSLGVKKGEKIPKKELDKAAEKSGKTGQRARLAETLRGFKKRSAKGGYHSKPMYGKGS